VKRIKNDLNSSGKMTFYGSEKDRNWSKTVVKRIKNDLNSSGKMTFYGSEKDRNWYKQ